jgi:AraC-like DNA-binding protein
MVVVFLPELLHHIPEQYSKTAARTPFICDNIPHPDRKAFYKILEIIYTEVGRKDSNYETIIIGAITQLIGLFLRYSETSCSSDRNASVGENGVSYIHKAISYIESNYSDDITLGDLARHLNISNSHLSRLFHRVTGMTFKEYLNHIRIEKAENQICFTNKKIIDIAFECGYNNLRTFNREFLSVKNKRPSNLRKDRLEINLRS